MYLPTLLLSLLSINLSVSLSAPNSHSIDLDYHINAKRDAGWCTLHYLQSTTGGSKLFIYHAAPSGRTGPILGDYTSLSNDALAPLPGYADFPVAVNDVSNYVTSSPYGTVTGDTWTNCRVIQVTTLHIISVMLAIGIMVVRGLWIVDFVLRNIPTRM